MGKYAWLFFFLTFLFSCDDIVEEDISDNTVSLLAPGDGTTIPDGNQIFWWEELDGATSYQLQVVTPSFDSISNLIADIEVTEGTQSEVTLATGVYQWRVIGKNFGYETEENLIFDLIVENDTVNNLSGTTLILSNPLSDAATNAATIEFSWQPLTNASSYIFQLASPDFSNNAFIQANELLETTTYMAILDEGEYSWRVRGENDTSVTPFTERSFTVDRTAPSAPVLNTPADGAEITLPIVLSWTPDSGAFADTLYVYKDSLVSPAILIEGTTATSFSFDNNSSSQYFWRLKSVDKANNLSGFSELRKFVVQ